MSIISKLAIHEIIDLCDAHGGGMTVSQAVEMQEIVSRSQWAEIDTADIPDREWVGMVDEATDTLRINDNVFIDEQGHSYEGCTGQIIRISDGGTLAVVHVFGLGVYLTWCFKLTDLLPE